MFGHAERESRAGRLAERGRKQAGSAGTEKGDREAVDEKQMPTWTREEEAPTHVFVSRIAFSHSRSVSNQITFVTLQNVP